MKSTRPYLIRAFYEWIADCEYTPHIVVNAEAPDVHVPEEFVEGGQIVLNISMPAVQTLSLGNDAISFQARFNGVAHEIYVPISAVMAIYARENGRGMVFSDDDDDMTEINEINENEIEAKEIEAQVIKEEKSDKGAKSRGKKPPHLTVVK